MCDLRNLATVCRLRIGAMPRSNAPLGSQKLALGSQKDAPLGAQKGTMTGAQKLALGSQKLAPLGAQKLALRGTKTCPGVTKRCPIGAQKLAPIGGLNQGTFLCPDLGTFDSQWKYKNG